MYVPGSKHHYPYFTSQSQDSELLLKIQSRSLDLGPLHWSLDFFPLLSYYIPIVESQITKNFIKVMCSICQKPTVDSCLERLPSTNVFMV